MGARNVEIFLKNRFSRLLPPEIFWSPSEGEVRQRNLWSDLKNAIYTYNRPRKCNVKVTRDITGTRKKGSERVYFAKRQLKSSKLLKIQKSLSLLIHHAHATHRTWQKPFHSLFESTKLKHWHDTGCGRTSARFGEAESGDNCKDR